MPEARKRPGVHLHTKTNCRGRIHTTAWRVVAEKAGQGPDGSRAGEGVCGLPHPGRKKRGKVEHGENEVKKHVEEGGEGNTKCKSPSLLTWKERVKQGKKKKHGSQPKEVKTTGQERKGKKGTYIRRGEQTAEKGRREVKKKKKKKNKNGKKRVDVACREGKVKRTSGTQPAEARGGKSLRS